MPRDKKGEWRMTPPSESNLWGKMEFVEGHYYEDANGRIVRSKGYYRMKPESRRKR